jgi:hypothetical protein
MTTHETGGAHGLYPFLQSPSSLRLSLTKTHIHFTDTHIIYPPPASYSPHKHHDHSINFVQHNNPTIPQRQLRFLFFDFVLYELIL